MYIYICEKHDHGVHSQIHVNLWECFREENSGVADDSIIAEPIFYGMVFMKITIKAVHILSHCCPQMFHYHTRTAQNHSLLPQTD